MSAEHSIWIRYAAENFEVARLCSESALYNPAVQNTQQSVEKALKALLLFKGLPLKKTHSIAALREQLLDIGFDCTLKDEDCDLLDSVYLPSKYPLGAVLPDFEPDETITKRCLLIAEKVLSIASSEMQRMKDAQ